MSLELTGKLIVKGDTQHVSDKFKKREFVIETAEDINGKIYTNYAKFQLSQMRCDVLDKFNVGSGIKVSFNVKGAKYEKEGKTNYFMSLDAWKIEAASGHTVAETNTKPQFTQDSEYVPF